MAVSTRFHEGVLEILLTNPPVNALSHAVRTGILAALDEAAANPAIEAVVLRGEGRAFSAGADIAEFDAGPATPLLPQVVDAIEACAKPVVAALHGDALGGGLELALACHYRIATSNARLGLPEVKLGLIPGAGGTQRLPRLVGAEQALAMIVGGTPITGEQAKAIGLVDELAESDDLFDAALSFAVKVHAPRRTGDREVTASEELFERFRRDNGRLIAGLEAPVACIEAVRASVETPLEEGLRLEHDLFIRLLDGSQARGLRHAFFAERLASRIEGLSADVAPRPVRSVAIVGAGTMGCGIAINFLSVGILVRILDRDQEALDRARDHIRSIYDASAARGRIERAEIDKRMALLTPTLDFAALGECDLLIEAVYEDMAVKLETFRQLDAIARPGAILATNTSFLDVDELAAETGRPKDVVGLHFFSPAHVMRLLEVVRGARTAPDVLATAVALARKIGKVPVVSGVCDGFIGNRILFTRQREAEALVLEGASPQQVDKVHLDLGMPMGPFQMADLAGLDVGWHRDPARVDHLRDLLCAMGRFGQKSKAGFYDYPDGRTPKPSDTVEEAIAGYRRARDVTPRDISDDEIRARTLYVMVNEAAKVLEEGIAQRAPDIDVVWLYGYGWPRITGGLVHWAEEIGLSTIVEGLMRYAGRMPETFTISPLLEECAARGSPLTLDRAA